METLRDLIRYLSRRKTLWLAPLLLAALILGALLLFVQGAAVTPFVYTLF
jgi:hypothetical protein